MFGFFSIMFYVSASCRVISAAFFICHKTEFQAICANTNYSKNCSKREPPTKGVFKKKQTPNDTTILKIKF